MKIVQEFPGKYEASINSVYRVVCCSDEVQLCEQRRKMNDVMFDVFFGIVEL